MHCVCGTHAWTLRPHGDRARQHVALPPHDASDPLDHRCVCEQRCGTPAGEHLVAMGVQKSGLGRGQPSSPTARRAVIVVFVVRILWPISHDILAVCRLRLNLNAFSLTRAARWSSEEVVKLLDMVGKTFGLLTVIERAGSVSRSDGGQSHATWRVRCVCGNERIHSGSNLRRGNSYSCGCQKRKAPARPVTPLKDRFWRHVDRSGGPEACWPWTGYRLARMKYGRLSEDDGGVLAHRAAFELSGGVIPPGMIVMHQCDNPPCCNPTHLRVGTIADNNRDRDQKGRAAKGPRNGNYTKPLAQPRGEMARAATISETTARAVLAAHRAKNGSHTEIAARFGVSVRMVRAIAYGETWKHLQAANDQREARSVG